MNGGGTAPRKPPGSREEHVEVDGLSLRVARVGGGPPLVLINGIGAAIEMLDPLSRRLEGHEVISIELPGCGRSSLPRAPVRMKQLAGIVASAMRALGCDRADVLGYSFGGAVAQELAYRFPHQVDRLILCATTPGLPAVPPGPMVTAMMLSPARYYSKSLGTLIVPRIVGGETARNRAVLDAGLEQRLRHPPGLLGYAFQLYAITGWSSQAWLHRVASKTLVLHGDDDPLTPLVNARWMAHRIPQARLRVLRGSGHLFLIDEAATARNLILGFLAEQRARPATA